MADTPTVDQMRAELAAKKDDSKEKRTTITAPGAGGVTGIVVPKHLIEGNPKAGAEGLKNMMSARAKVYGEEHREPLNLGQVAKIHKQTLEEHFAKPLAEQKSAEQDALNKIREAKFIKHNRDTLDESEKLDTVEHEHDEQGRSHVGYASKGIAGHALFPKGHGENMDYKVINTCPGQTEGCGGGKNAQGIIDTKQGTCFAPNAESQYAAAVSRRAGHAIAKHDPAMTKDWIIAHTGSMRNAAGRADKQNKRMLYRPNVVDETDVSSRHVIRHLNEQRKIDDKPAIIANSYGKTNELHDPENGYHVTHSNVGPKTKKGASIAENIARDKSRVRNTVMAADNKGDFKNEQGNLTPPKGSYMVTDVKRGSPLAKNMEKAITHGKYWSTGRPQSELTEEEKAEGPEGHFGPSGKPTTPDKAHFGHTTLKDMRFDYQKQHILHPRLVQVGKNDDGTPHIIPTDSRFKDEEFLPKNRFMTKNGKKAGHLLMTTPTESTSNLGHQTSFTHHVNAKHVEHALKNKGEYEIDAPGEQIKSAGKEYVPPQPVKFYAEGGRVYNDRDDSGLGDDDFHAFPERNYHAQRHLALRADMDERGGRAHHRQRPRTKVRMSTNPDEMLAHIMLHKAAGGSVAPDAANGISTDFGDYEGGPSDMPGTDPMQYLANGGGVKPSNVGVEEAPAMPVKLYMPPGGGGMPVGGVDFQPENPGHQMLPAMPQGQLGQPPQGMQAPQGMPPQGAPGQPPQGMPQGPQSNILQLTPQGQAMSAMRATPPGMPRMAEGGAVTGSGGIDVHIPLNAGGASTSSGGASTSGGGTSTKSLDDTNSLGSMLTPQPYGGNDSGRNFFGNAMTSTSRPATNNLLRNTTYDINKPAQGSNMPYVPAPQPTSPIAAPQPASRPAQQEAVERPASPLTPPAATVSPSGSYQNDQFVPDGGSVPQQPVSPQPASPIAAPPPVAMPKSPSGGLGGLAGPVAKDDAFYQSPEYRAFQNDPSNMIGTMDMYDSPYFGSVGSGSIGRAQDAAYRKYKGIAEPEVKRIGGYAPSMPGATGIGAGGNLTGLGGLLQNRSFATGGVVKRAAGGSTNPSVEEMRRAIAGAAKSSGMKEPVVANKQLTNMQDFHTSLHDRIRERATDMQDMVESMPFKYDKGHRVFTEDSAKKNKPPYTIIRRVPFGNQVVREEGSLKARKDPQTGKTMRTPYEPGYHVRYQQGDDWSEFHIPESAIKGRVKMAGGGRVSDIDIEERPL
jgi:hypothetical protein